MSSELTPSVVPTPPASPSFAPAGIPAAWAPQQPEVPSEEGGGNTLLRYVRVLFRYKWLLVLLTIVGGALGYGAGRMTKPQYEARATVWIAAPTPPNRDQSGPIRAEELLASVSWSELFRSFAIVDSVVTQLNLNVTPVDRGDAKILAGLRTAPRLYTDDYTLTIDATGKRYSLSHKTGTNIETGTLGDSIGIRTGFLWRPDPSLFRPGQVVRFNITTPREASVALLERITVEQQFQSNFLKLHLTGRDPVRTAEILNLWVKDFVETAAELKRRNLTEFSRILADQLDYSSRQLRDAESALETFRYNTITQPSENAMIAPGLEATRDPVITAFFNEKVTFDNLKRDRTALEKMLADIRAGRAGAEVLATIPGLLTTPGNETLANVMKDLYAKEAELRAKQQIYTDEHPTVKALKQEIATLRTQTIPAAATDVLSQMRQRESDLGLRIDGESKELRDIPTRTIEEMRLRRAVNVAEGLYTQLQSRYEEAKLSEASSSPDVTALDMASPPDRPITDTKYKILGIALAGGFGLGIALALLLDRMDHRFRYPEQVTETLRLPILGTVPTLRRGSHKDATEEAAQILESFRGIRLRLQQFHPPGEPIVCTITSANEGDGKSMISANLALSLAEAGYRTLLIDGDTRRGTLHQLFAAERRPGLIECLTGAATVAEAARPTSERRLTLIPCGGRGRRNPEIIASSALPQLLTMLRREYDAIVVDSPPLGAGIDAFALGTACGNVTIVLRHGRSDLRMAGVKLELLRQLPLRTHGAILNEIKAEGQYKYYAYSSAYSDPSAHYDEIGAGDPVAGRLIENG